MFNEYIKYNYQVTPLIEVNNNHIIDFSIVLFCYLTGIFLMGSLLCSLFCSLIIVTTFNLLPGYEWNVYIPKDSYIEAQTPNMMFVGGGAFGRW